MNHWKVVCRSSKTPSQLKQQQSTRTRRKQSSHTRVHAIREEAPDVDENLYFHSLETADDNTEALVKLPVTSSQCRKKLNYKPDTGAQGNALPKNPHLQGPPSAKFL